jgi:hypothetical protein
MPDNDDKIMGIAVSAETSLIVSLIKAAITSTHEHIAAAGCSGELFD